MNLRKTPIAVIDKEEESVEKISGLLKNVSDLEIIQASTSLTQLLQFDHEK
jgi:hypothetical protein